MLESADPHGIIGTYTSTLADYASSATFESTPTEVVARTKYLMLDGFGCGIFGSSLAWSAITTQTVLALGSGGPAGAWGTGRLVAADHASLLNGTYVQAFELDDYSREGGYHACSLVVPAVMAASALRGGVTGKQVLAATVVGFEVGNRVGRCIGPTRVTSQGWHTGAILGPIAAAAAAGNILGLDQAGMENAFGIAATQASGLMSVQYGAMVKRMHHGHASQSGLLAAALATRGYTGIDSVFELPFGGYCTTFTGSPDQFDLDALIDGLGVDYRTLGTCIKPFACRGPINVALTALDDIRAERAFDSREVREVRVGCTKPTMLKCGWKYAATGSATEAQMNLSYGLAVMLLEGDAFVDQFRPQLLTDRRVLDLIERIRIRHDEDLDALGEGHRHHVRIEVELTDGTVLSAERDHARGSALDPLTDDAIVAKFDKLVSGRTDPSSAADVKELVMELDHLEDLEPLQRALVSA